MTLTTQFMTMLAMIGMGGMFGASLDTYQRFLKRTERKRWAVFINDILFWLLQGLAIFYILFLVNQGELRLYVFLALLCGFAAYQSLFKRIYLKLLEMLISMFISIYSFFVKFLKIFVINPIYALLSAVVAVIIMLGKATLALFLFQYKAIILILKILTQPLKWIFMLIWRLLPKHIKKTVDKFYRKLAGFFIKGKNYFVKKINSWKKTD
jgi:spore cortex biosynthesis protein YabQ